MISFFPQLKQLFLQAFRRFREDEGSRFGASIAYYSVFSLVPVLSIATMIAGIFLGADTVRQEILSETSTYLGAEGAQFIHEILRSASEERLGTGLTLLSLALVLVGAAAVFRELKDALHRVFDLEPEKGGVLAFFKKNLVLFALVLAVGFLLLATLVLSTLLSLANRFFTELFSLPGFFWQSLNFVVSFAITAGIFGLLYRYLPNRRMPWRFIRFGAVTTALLFTIGKSLIGFYLSQTDPASAYGAAGTLVLILLWAYYSSQIVLFGAELTAVYATEHGHLARRGEVVSPVSKKHGKQRGIVSKMAGMALLLVLRQLLKRIFRKF